MPSEKSLTVPIGIGSQEKVFTLHDAQTLTSGGQTANGSAIDVQKFRKFSLLNRVSQSGATSGKTIEVQVQFSPDGGTTWYDYVDGPFGALIYEGVQVSGVLFDVQLGDIGGPDIRAQLSSPSGAISTNNNLSATVKVLPF